MSIFFWLFIGLLIVVGEMCFSHYIETHPLDFDAYGIISRQRPRRGWQINEENDFVTLDDMYTDHIISRVRPRFHRRTGCPSNPRRSQ